MVALLLVETGEGMGSREISLRKRCCGQVEGWGTRSLFGVVLLAALSGVAQAAAPAVTAGQTAISTMGQSVTTISRDGSRRQFTRQIRVSTRQAAKAATSPSSAEPEALPAARVPVATGQGRIKPNVEPGYPGAVINSQNFGTVAVGQSVSMTLSYTFPSGATALYANFANGSNFSGSNSVCTSTGCSATFTFTPRYPGLAKDAIVTKDQNGNLVYETLIYGTGTAPQLGFDLGDLSTTTGITNQPDSVAVGPDGNYYITDASQNAVYKYTTSSSSSAQLQIPELGGPGGIAIDGANTLYITDKTNNRIVAYSEANAAQTTVLLTSALSNPTGIGVDGAGNLYVADTGNNRIEKIDTQGVQTDLATEILSPTSLAVDGAGNVFYVDGQNGGEVTELPAGGGSSISIAIGLGTLYDLAVDAGERIYISTPNGDTLISPDGTQVEYGGGSNYGMAVDPAGNVITTQPGSSGGIAITSRSASNFILTTQVGTTTTGGDTISNTGNSPLTLSNLAISGMVFTKDSTSVCVNGIVIQAGQKCDFSVDFAPPVAQSYQETYTATSNSLNVNTSTNADTLYGYGTGITTATTLSVNPNPVTTGQTVEFIATVMRTGTGVSGTTNGSTTFYDGTTALGTVSQANGASYAMYFTSTLAAGTHSITAKYNGDTINAASTSAAQSLLVMAGAASTTTLTSSPSSPRQGEPVTFHVAVAAGTSANAPPTPTGTVTLTNTASTPATELGTATLASDATAIFKYSLLPVGNASVVATYNGDANYGTSMSSADSFGVLAKEQTTTTLTATPMTVAYQTPITLTATVAVQDSHAGSGQVYFCDAAAAQCSLAANLGIAQINRNTVSATLKLAPGTIGTHNFTATFVPLQAFGGSTSAPATVSVTGKYPSTTTFATTGTDGNYSVTGTVVGTGSNTVSPTGLVSFLDTSNANGSLGSAGLGTASLGFTAVQPAGSPLTTGEESYGQAAGDFNGDGFADLVVENYEEDTVSVFLGNGDGTFRPAVKYTVGSEPERVLVADLDGDGNLDLIVANTGSSTISILLGNGDGTFRAQVTYPCASPVGLGVMDVDGDGFPDVVATDYYASTMSVLLGNQDGTLQAAVTYPAGRETQTLAEGDINGDGFPDVVVGNFEDNTVSVYLNNGDGTFQPMVTYAVGQQPQGVVLGDFNRDGALDLAVANSGSNTIGILFGRGDGTFLAQVPYAAGNTPVGIASADFNGDGILDLTVGNVSDNTQSILLGNVDGTFQAQQTFSTGNFPYGTSIGDFNGDGYPDIGVSNFSAGTATILLSQVTQTATATQNIVIGGSNDTAHAVEASYAGDTNVLASVSATMNLTGGGTAAAAQSATTLAITPATPTAGQSVTFAALVSGTAQMTPVPTGTVTLTNTAVTPAAVLGTITLGANGAGSFSTASLAAGTYMVVASYGGDASYLASMTAPEPLTVAKTAQTITFPAIPSHKAGDAPFTLGATASSGLAVSYAVTSGPATLAGNVVTLTGAGTVTIQATQAGNATFASATPVSQSFTVASVAMPTLSGISPVGAVAGSASTTVTLTGTSFTTTDQVTVNATVLTTTYVSASTLMAVIPANLLTAAGTLPLTVTDTASGNSSTVASFLIEVAPVVVFTGPTTAASGDQPVVTFQLKQPYAVPINCLLTLTFVPATATGIDDPAVQFSSGGRTINVTLPAGSTTTPDVQFQAGTVAGTITVTLTITAEDVNVTPASVAPVVVVLPTVVPQISAAKMASTTTAITVTVTGFSNTREVKSAIFHFTPTVGNTIANPDVTVDVTSIFATWFGNPTSDAYGSTFTYTQPFNLSDGATTIQGVTVTLVNAVGNSVVTTATQ